MTVELKKRFLETMFDVSRPDKTFAAHLRASLPSPAVRSTAILPNRFLLERWASRIITGAGGDRSTRVKTQLDKAPTAVKRAETEGVVA